MTSSKPNLLYLVHRFPYPPNRGDRIRSYHLLKYLASRYNVYLGTLWDEEPTSHELEVVVGLCKQVAAFPIGRYSRWLYAAARLAGGRSATEGLFQSTGLARCVRAWMSTVKFEYTWAYCSSMVQYVDRASKVPLIVDLVDVDSQKWFDYANYAQGWKRQLFALEGRRLRQLECLLPAACRAVTLVSRNEADIYRQICPNDRTFAVANGVDLEFFCPQVSGASSECSSRCVFVGALDYRANVQGLNWFCAHCWPTIRRLHPTATLELVGRNPTKCVRRLAEISGVHVVGTVPDVRPYLQGAATAIAPVQVARGIQNKVLEAMAMGIAVVGSPQAIEGIDCQLGKHVLQAATPAAWICHIVSLLNDPTKQKTIGIAAREFVERNYSWAVQLSQLQPLLERDSDVEQLAKKFSQVSCAETVVQLD